MTGVQTCALPISAQIFDRYALALGLSLGNNAPDEGGVVKVDTLVDCEFTEVKKGLKTGDMNMEVELPLIIGDIKYNQ